MEDLESLWTLGVGDWLKGRFTSQNGQIAFAADPRAASTHRRRTKRCIQWPI